MTGLQKNKEDTGSLTNVRKLVLKFAAMVLFAIPAAADPRYEADVNVDVTAATVTEAKKQAMAKQGPPVMSQPSSTQKYRADNQASTEVSVG